MEPIESTAEEIISSGRVEEKSQWLSSIGKSLIMLPAVIIGLLVGAFPLSVLIAYGIVLLFI